MWSLSRMNVEGAARRLRQLQWVLGYPGSPAPGALQLRLASSDSGGKKVSIGDVSIEVKDPKCLELVPRKFLSKTQPQSLLRHLRWIMQKDILGQDVFLIGAPGPLRRYIAMSYLELTKREAEYVSLSRDTTESDLKQRREIRGGTAYYIDQSAVKAALEGRVLVLEGIEKAERNVLPVLNNLLENREMQLDDGRFLVAADHYDKLLQDHSKEELDALKLVRVSEKFRVISLGLPIPRYQGNPLDPPLRSRFQARDIQPLPFKELLQILQDKTKNLPPDRISQLLSFTSAILTKESSTLGLPDFPVDNLGHIIKVLDQVPGLSSHQAVQRLYPYQLMLGTEGKIAVNDLLKKFELYDLGVPSGSVKHVERMTSLATVTLDMAGSSVSLKVPTGMMASGQKNHGVTFIDTLYHSSILAEMLQSHMVKDFCLVGPRGCGKSAVVRHFADLLGYHIEPVMLYQDMTSRDLLQQRATLPNGDTVWRPSPLVTAAQEGSLAVLDGVHRINPGSFAVLHRLLHERELQLFDGSRLLRQDKYNDIKSSTGLTDQQLAEKKIFAIHPSFRMVALSEPPQVGSSKQQWMTPEVLTMFLYHNMRPLSRAEELDVITRMVPNAPDLSKLFDFVHKLRESTDATMQSLASSLSTRQLLRIARSLAQFPNDDLFSVVHKACMARFLPRLARTALDQALDSVGILPAKQEQLDDDYDKSVTCEVKDGILRIGSTELPVYNPENRSKVPDILFYENPQHLAVMEDMLRDFSLGEHLLLVGNQGVGKNKIVDRFLQLLCRPREYIQLHRDTTVQTLTLQPTVQDGVIVYEDSPLVRAVKQGHILVVDEADKAPTHVTCVLKTLVESGEMHLADGRRIVSASAGLKPSPSVIVAHPDFRMMVLANRPGFPFLGNDFFSAMGDIFSCHAIDNPDVESELAMLRRYGPNVPEATLLRLVAAFGELRDMADQGQIAYPYSTREVVNMVRHLQKYPNEGLTTVVRNVFDFDSYNTELKETLVTTMHKHGIPIGATEASVSLAKELELPEPRQCGTWKVATQGIRQKTALMSLPVETRKVSVKGPVEMAVQLRPVERVETRAAVFTEQEAYWKIPMEEASFVSDLDVCQAAARSPGHQRADVIYIGTVNPMGLYAVSTRAFHLSYMDLYDIFPASISHHKPRLILQPLPAPMDESVLLHEEVTNVVLQVNIASGHVTRLMSQGMPEVPLDQRRWPSYRPTNKSPYRLCKSTVQDLFVSVVFYKKDGEIVEVLGMLEGISHTVQLPIAIGNMQQVSMNQWLVEESKTNKKYLLHRKTSAEFVLQDIQESGEGLQGELVLSSVTPLSPGALSQALGQTIESPNRVVATNSSYASVILGFPELSESELYTISRDALPEAAESNQGDLLSGLMVRPQVSDSRVSIAFLPESGQVVRALPTWQVPKGIIEDESKARDLNGFLEVTDMANRKLRYIPVPGAVHIPPYMSQLFSIYGSGTFVATLTGDGLVTLDVGGCLRLWETSLVHLERSLKEWRNMLGYEDARPLQLNIERESGRDHENIDPKHGKTDPTNAPHIGGNTWAGGVGGSGTAGLGGFGGPYRLDAGNTVYQVPDWEKDAVPESVRQAAREVAQKAFKERLREINMSEFDAETYEKFAKSVRRQVQSLRVILDSLQAKGKERQWLKNQTYGDLDDARLIEGLTGEKSIYKRRGEKEPEMGSPQEHPKRLRLLVDVSGSMYRFNGHDGRLEREMEAALMVMEAFEKYEDKFKYDIFGHSGEDHRVEFVNADKPPRNDKERLVVLKMMHAHAQFCLSGDTTLEATKHAIEVVAKEEADEHFVIVLSDANFDRYGIRPSRFGEILTGGENVNGYAIFIGSLGDQATRLSKQLPMGHSYICMDNKNLPQILQQIFTSTMLST